MNVLSGEKLYLAVDLDRTVIDSYTLEGLKKLLLVDSLGERVKANVVSHYLALENYRLTGEIPWFMLAMYGKVNVKVEQDSIYIERERGSRLVFTKYPNGCPVIFWIRPGWDTFLELIPKRYFTCFITQSARMHATLALKILGVHAPTDGSSRDGVNVLTVAREDRKVITKAFCLTGASAEKCWVGLDDLCDGIDMSSDNLNGVAIWQPDDLKAILKPVPFHAFSEEAGKSDAISLEICSNILTGIHTRFVACLNSALQAGKTYDALLSCSLPRVEDLVAYYHRNNTTSEQRVSSFIETVISERFYKKPA